MNTIRNAFETVKGTIVDALTVSEPVIPRSDIIALEEKERQYRIEHVAQSTIERENGRNVSSLISALQFPVFKGGLNKGFKAYTRRAEEQERNRMLASKQELALRKTNAHLLASSINGLGWPFIRNASAPRFILTDGFRLLEEEERDNRIADKARMMASRNNAALVSNLIRWDNYQRHTNAGAKRITKNMEEKERKSRLTDRAEQERAADLAFQTSGLIRRLGWPFYVQPVYDNKDYTKSLEESERSLRLINPHERMMAKENSSLVADLIHSKDAAYLAEKEKDRRLQDTLEQERHKAHSRQLANIVGKQFDASEVERRRLLADKAHSREAQLGAKKVAEIVPHFMSVSSWNINRAVEKERSRKLNDITAIAFAKFNAKKVSQLILDADTEKKTAWTNELEQERIRRMHDRAASDLAKKNARKVSKMVLRQKSGSLSAAESERARRIADLNEQQRHRAAAKKLSELVRENSLPKELIQEQPTPVGQGTRSVPAELLSAPSSSATAPPAGYPGSATEAATPLAAGVGSRSIPFDYPSSSEQAPTSYPVSYEQMPTSYPASSEQMPYSYPVSSEQMPYSAAYPVASNNAMPTYYSPSMPSMVYSSPSTMPVMSYPSAQPTTVVYRSSPTTMPMNYSSVAPTYLPGLAPSTVPFDAAVPSHLRVMTDKERKKLEKQASRHSRTAAREQRRAEHDLSKAEKLHFRGKDSRALKHESKAEQHNVAAKHHQAWAQELAADSLGHTLPGALPTVFRPAM